MFEVKGKFPAGSVRESVERAGDSWQGYRACNGAPHNALADRVVVVDARIVTADSVVMLTASRVRLAGISPAQRVDWDMRIAAAERGEYL